VSLGQGHFQQLNHLRLEGGVVVAGNSPFIFSSSLNASRNAIERRLGLKRAYQSLVSLTDFSFQSFLLRCRLVLGID